MCVDIWIGYLRFLVTIVTICHLRCSLTLTVLYKPMLSFSSKLFIPLAYLFITIASLVQSHEINFNRRGHDDPKRFLKKRSFPDIPVVNPAPALPSASSGSQIATSIISQSTADTSPTTVRVYLLHSKVGI